MFNINRHQANNNEEDDHKFPPRQTKGDKEMDAALALRDIGDRLKDVGNVMVEVKSTLSSDELSSSREKDAVVSLVFVQQCLSKNILLYPTNLF
jgi:hypothetical protein